MNALQTVSQGIMTYCLRGLLGNQQRKAVFMFLSVCSKIFAEKQSLQKLDQLLAEVNMALERDMPVTIQVRIMHTLKSDAALCMKTCCRFHKPITVDVAV